MQKTSLISENFSKSIVLACAALAVLANTFMATNSDHLPPIFRDSIVCFLLFLCVLFTKKSSKFNLYEINISKKEGYLVTGALILVLAVCARAAVSVWTHSTDYNDCSAVGSLLHRTECILFASSIGNSSIRIALPHIFAFAIALTSLFITKNIANRAKCLFFISITTIIVFSLEEILGTAAVTRTLYQELFGTQLAEGYQLMSGPFTNYGWTWPYIVPIAAISMWIFASGHTFKMRLSGFVLLTICGWIIFTNSQRGGVLTFIICTFVTSIWFLYSTIVKKNKTVSRFARYLSISIFILLALIITGLFFTDDMDSINSVTSRFGLTIRKSPFTSSDARLGLWQYGFEMWKINPIFGNGHGSWLWMSLEHGGRLRKSAIFDSAHNLYVQMLAELGVIHTLIILAGFVFVGRAIFQNLKREKNGTLLFLLLLISFLVATMVQEIDYIRTTYYQWAAVIGIVAADLDPKSRQITRRIGRPMLILPLVVYCVFFALYSFFSTGVYAFEPREKSNAWPAWGRWLTDDAVLKATAGRFGSKGFTVFPILMTHMPASENVYSEDSAKLLQGAEIGDYVFASVAGQSWRIAKKSVQFTGKHAIDSRTVSGRIGYPTFQSKTNLIWARNIDVVMNQGELELQCKTTSCFLLFGACRSDLEKPSFGILGSKVSIHSRSFNFPVDIATSINLNPTNATDKEVDAQSARQQWSPQSFQNSKSLLVTITSLDKSPSQISNLSCK